MIEHTKQLDYIFNVINHVNNMVYAKYDDKIDAVLHCTVKIGTYGTTVFIHFDDLNIDDLNSYVEIHIGGNMKCGNEILVDGNYCGTDNLSTVFDTVLKFALANCEKYNLSTDELYHYE